MSLSSASSSRPRSRGVTRVLLVIATVFATLVTSFATSNLTADAQTGSQVSAPTAFNPYVIRPDVVHGLLSPRFSSNETQLLTGPNAAGRPVVRGVGNNVVFADLVPSSTYTFRARNVQPGRTPSRWVTHTFTTAANFTARPSAPTNLRLTSSTADQIRVTWDAPTSAGPFQYEPRVNGARVSLACVTYCTDLDTRTAVFARPAAGTTVTFTVAARDVNFNLSLPASLTVTG